MHWSANIIKYIYVYIVSTDTAKKNSFHLCIPQLFFRTATNFSTEFIWTTVFTTIFFWKTCHSFSFRLLHSSIRRYQERSNEVLKHVHQNGIEPSYMVQHGLCTLITVILYPTETISMTTKSQLCHPLCFLLPFYSDPDLFLQLISYI